MVEIEAIHWMLRIVSDLLHFIFPKKKHHQSLITVQTNSVTTNQCTNEHNWKEERSPKVNSFENCDEIKRYVQNFG